MKERSRFALKELMASVVVFLVALPLCMGIAIASGVPPALGLISGIVGGLVVGFIAGSPLQVSGPAAGLAVIIWELVQKHGLEALGAVVLLGGLFQVVAGVLRLGRWFRAVSPAVIHGMLGGIGVLIFASQFHVMVDDKPKGSGLINLLSIPEAVSKGLFPMDGSSHQLAALIGLVTILSLALWAAFRPQKLSFLPGPLIAVILAVGLAFAYGMQIKYISVPKNLFASSTLFSWDSLGILMKGEMIVAALALAIVASAESLLCASAVDQMHQGVRTNYDKELWAQGVGNMLCGLLGALPITGVIVRSSANVEAGASTRASAIFHGIWLLAFVVSLPFILNMIPVSALAAILVYTGYKLVNIGRMRELWQTSRSEFGIYMATLITIVCFDLLTGVLLGLGLSIGKLVYVFSHLEIQVFEDKEQNRFDVNVSGSATFIRLPMLASALEKLPNQAEVHIHLGSLSYIDHACIELLQEREKQLVAGGGSLVVEWDTLTHKFRSGPSYAKAEPTLSHPSSVLVTTLTTHKL